MKIAIKDLAALGAIGLFSTTIIFWSSLARAML